jgi:hypothetical protein
VKEPSKQDSSKPRATDGGDGDGGNGLELLTVEAEEEAKKESNNAPEEDEQEEGEQEKSNNVAAFISSKPIPFISVELNPDSDDDDGDFGVERGSSGHAS